MSRYAAFDKHTGRHEDIVVKRREHGRNIVMLGDRPIGEIHGGPESYTKWTAISHVHPPDLVGLRMVRGFATRWHAVEYLLQVGVHSDLPY